MSSKQGGKVPKVEKKEYDEVHRQGVEVKYVKMSQSKLQALRSVVLLSVTDLPSEILGDIFLRLPVKALVRVRWTCKLWHAVVTDPEFVEKHRKDSVRKSPGYLYRYEPDHNIYYIESSGNVLSSPISGDLNDAAEYDLGLLYSAESIRIPYGAIGYVLSQRTSSTTGEQLRLQSSGGLCAFLSYTEGCFCVCNPFIGEQIKVLIGSFLQGWNYSFSPLFWWAFSYSPTSKLYKIFVLRNDRNDRNENVSRGYVYTLGSGSTTWRKLRDDFPFWAYRYGNNVGCEEGNLLFFLGTNNRYDKIVSLDVELENYRIWKNPYKTLDRFTSSYSASLLTYGNTVAYGVKFLKKPGFSMWVLRDRVNETWVKEINISLETMRSYPLFVNYREWINGGTLFGCDGHMNGILYDAEANKWKSLFYPYSKSSDGSRRSPYFFYRHSPSLVSPKQIMGLAASHVP